VNIININYIKIRGGGEEEEKKKKEERERE
jgi:hypothetical protein